LLRSFIALTIAALTVALLIAHAPNAAEPESNTPANVEAKKASPSVPLVQSFDKAEEIKYPWGWIRWLMNDKIDPKAEMTFGIVYVKANQRNPLHVHPNCAEYLHMLSGSCEHLVGKKWLKLKAGDTVRIPAGVPHVARTLDEPMRAVIVYSAGNRQFEVVGEGEKE
jgi:quercetin dioxygenase-like cupin family protein